MKKVFVTGLCMLMTAAMLGGCSKNDTKNVGEDGKETETDVNIDSVKEPELEDLKITLGTWKLPLRLCQILQIKKWKIN